MSARPILYSFRRCPYAMRARMGLLAADITVELREVILRDKPEDMIAASPKATVPVLVLDDGTVLEESLDVIDWALQQSDAGGLLSVTPDDQRALIQDMDATFKPHLDRYKYPNRYTDAAQTDHRAEGLKWIIHNLAPRLEIAENLFRDEASLADIAIFPFIRQFAHVDRDWFYSATPKQVGGWLQRHLASNRFLQIMKKYPKWQSGTDGVLFPEK